jgi:hypothetical protein
MCFSNEMKKVIICVFFTPTEKNKLSPTAFDLPTQSMSPEDDILQ